MHRARADEEVSRRSLVADEEVVRRCSWPTRAVAALRRSRRTRRYTAARLLAADKQFGRPTPLVADKEFGQTPHPPRAIAGQTPRPLKGRVVRPHPLRAARGGRRPRPSSAASAVARPMSSSARSDHRINSFGVNCSKTAFLSIKIMG